MFRALAASLLRIRNIIILIGLIAVAVLIWYVGPLLSLGGYAPLEDPGLRAGIIVCLFVGALLIAVGRIWLARRANASMIRNLLDSENLAALADNQSSEEVQLIRERFDRALAVLRETTVGKENGGTYLAELPWYIIIGPPGAGKTTILKNSGLNFPLAERLGVDPVSGIGGTRHCDWWFTDEAVLIDTAGRYTTQDVNSEVDRAAWRGFLELLVKHRRRRPINGVIIAISLADIIGQSASDRRRHVEAIKLRLQELMRTFGMRLPVYVLLTKCDLVAGFSEYFDDLDDDDRAQVWGMTFPNEGDQILKDFDGRFSELGERIEAGVLQRMDEERNLLRRSRIYCFPKEFASLKTQVGNFLNDTFRPSRFELQPQLRGVYCTSGTQEGTPIDRLLGAMSRSFGLSAGHRTPFSGKGKAFFIRRFLTDIVFEEQGLIGSNRVLERKIATMHTITYAAMAVLLVGFGLAWFSAYARSASDIADTKAAADRLSTDLSGLPQHAPFERLVPVLNEAKAVADAASDESLLGQLQSFGLSARSSLSPSAGGAYDRVLVQWLLPSFADRIGGRISAGLDQPVIDTAGLRGLVRTYLMLADPTHFDRGIVGDAARNEAPLAFPIDADSRKAITGHLDQMVALLPKPVDVDQRLIDEARTRLTRVPPADQVYAHLLREGLASQSLHNVDLLPVIGSVSLQAMPDKNGDQSLVVPGVFTHDGFYDFFLPRLPVIVREELGSDWVTGESTVDNSVVQSVSKDVAQRYIRDYIATWQSALQRVGAVKFADMTRGMSVLQGLAAPQSPLDQLIDAVRQNVDLPPPGQQSNVVSSTQGAAPAPPAAAVIQVAAGAATKAATETTFGDMPWPGLTISQAFTPLLKIAVPGDAGQIPPMAHIRDLFSSLFGTMSNIANAPQPPMAAYQLAAQRAKQASTDVLGSMRADAVLRPEPIRSIMRSLANSSWAVLLDLAHQQIQFAWNNDALPVCQSSIFNRYPIYSDGTQEVQLADFGTFFRPGGVMDDFYQKNLAPFVIEKGGSYTPATIDGIAMPISAAALANFYRAKLVRGAFFNGTDASPSVKFSIRATYLSQTVFGATLDFDGHEIVYRHEPPRSFDLQWPNQNNSSTVSVTFATTDGKESKVEQTGPWSLFRFIDPNMRARSDYYDLAVTADDGSSVKYELRAASVNNPFGLGALRSFRCPDTL